MDAMGKGGGGHHIFSESTHLTEQYVFCVGENV